MHHFSQMGKIAAATALTVMLLRGASGAPIRFESGEDRVALVELYTSEGCSSCPPAEAWLSGLQDSPRLWKDFAPIGFHVDYWDSLGWKDTLADPEFAERQRAYAQLWHAENIYTPEFILDGKEWFGWTAGKDGPAASHEPAGVLTATSTDTNLWEVHFVPENATGTHYDIHAALTAGGMDANVKAGENRGRRLHHDFAVVDLVQIGLTTTNGTARGKFIVKTPLIKAGNTLALTVWVTRAGELMPLQTAGGWLVAPVKKQL